MRLGFPRSLIKPAGWWIGAAAISGSILLEAASAQQQPANKPAKPVVGTAKVDAPQKPQIKSIKAPPVAGPYMDHIYYDPPPRVDPLSERALRLRLADAPSVRIHHGIIR
jgi:hypothetical protein